MSETSYVSGPKLPLPSPPLRSRGGGTAGQHCGPTQPAQRLRAYAFRYACAPEGAGAIESRNFSYASISGISGCVG